MTISIDINVYHHLVADEFSAGLLKTLEAFVGQVKDGIVKLEAAVLDAGTAQDAAFQRVGATLADLNARIAQGENDPALVAKIQDLQSMVETLKKNADALDSTPDVAPVTEPTEPT